MGEVYTDAEALLSAAEPPIVAVGDIVTYHLIEADRRPDVALIDGRTKRSTIEDHVREAIDAGVFDREVEVVNAAAGLSAALLSALSTAIDAAGDGESTVIVVDGEEDLATLPAIAAAPTGASVVYGQPDEGMVLVECEAGVRSRVSDLLGRMDGDTERLWELLEG
ncbi:MAG: GTP-dependent dephospho-CoA kinase family protein [Halorientalis sp.]